MLPCVRRMEGNTPLLVWWLVPWRHFFCLRHETQTHSAEAKNNNKKPRLYPSCSIEAKGAEPVYSLEPIIQRNHRTGRKRPTRGLSR